MPACQKLFSQPFLGSFSNALEFVFRTGIAWEKDGRQLPFNDRQTVFPNGTMVISHVQRKEDAATYTCVARNDEGYSARSDLSVSVMGKIVNWMT